MLYVKVANNDNVAIAIKDLKKGTDVGDGIILNEDIPQAHKLALVDIKKGDPVIRYNVLLKNYCAKLLSDERAEIKRIAKENNKKVLLFAGGISDELDNYNNYGFDAYFPIVRGVTTLDKALDKNIASTNITNTVEQVFRVIKLEKGM